MTMDNPPNVERSIADMSDRDIAEETLYWMRLAGQAIAQFQSGGMTKMLMGMMGGGRKPNGDSR